MAAILLAVLKGIGIFLLVILALLVLLMLLPVTVEPCYERKVFSVKVRLAGIRVYRFSTDKPPKPKKPKKQKKKPAAETPPPPKKQKPAKKFQLTLDKIKSLVSVAGWAMRRMFLALYIHDVRVRLPIHGEDSAQTAIQYGQMNAYLHSSLAFLHNFFRFTVDELTLKADFLDEEYGTEYFSCKITTHLIIMSAIGIWVLIRLKKEKVF